jgi:tetratricopeptide (TPR) repeat protein
MNEHDGGKPPEVWLVHLREARHWDRLIALASKRLEADPNDPKTHRHIAWAYAASNRPTEMWPHVDFLLKTEADELGTHHLAAVHFLDTHRPKQAWPHIQTLLREAPNSPTYHYLACLYGLRVNDVRSARVHITQARQLAPDWVAAAHLEIRMDSIGNRRASDAWARIHRLEKTLSLDARNAAVLTTIGEIYLAELERPRDAERFFRQALFIDPHDKRCQQKLLHSIRDRSLLYRTLSLPYRAACQIATSIRERRVRIVLLVIAVKAVLLFVAWLVLAGVFLTPAAIVYEWLVLTDLPRTRPWPQWISPVLTVLRWPLWLRFAVCSSLIVAFWLFILHQVFHLQFLDAFQFVGLIFLIHFVPVAVFVGVRRLRSRYGAWQDELRRRREFRLTPGSAAP